MSKKPKAHRDFEQLLIDLAFQAQALPKKTQLACCRQAGNVPRIHFARWGLEGVAVLCLDPAWHHWQLLEASYTTKGIGARWAHGEDWLESVGRVAATTLAAISGVGHGKGLQLLQVALTLRYTP